MSEIVAKCEDCNLYFDRREIHDGTCLTCYLEHGSKASRIIALEKAVAHLKALVTDCTIAKLDLQPDDVLVVRSPKRLRPEQREHLQHGLARQFPGRKIVVLSEGLSFEVVRKAAEAERAFEPITLHAKLGSFPIPFHLQAAVASAVDAEPRCTCTTLLNGHTAGCPLAK